MKIDLSNNQQRIDVIKEQLIEAFEQWYSTEFDMPEGGMMGAYDHNMESDKEARHETDSNAIDEDQATYMRAKRKVDTLAKAKRLEKQIGVRK